MQTESIMAITELFKSGYGWQVIIFMGMCVILAAIIGAIIAARWLGNFVDMRLTPPIKKHVEASTATAESVEAVLSLTTGANERLAELRGELSAHREKWESVADANFKNQAALAKGMRENQAALSRIESELKRIGFTSDQARQLLSLLLPSMSLVDGQKESGHDPEDN